MRFRLSLFLLVAPLVFLAVTKVAKADASGHVYMWYLDFGDDVEVDAIAWTNSGYEEGFYYDKHLSAQLWDESTGQVVAWDSYSGPFNDGPGLGMWVSGKRGVRYDVVFVVCVTLVFFDGDNYWDMFDFYRYAFDPPAWWDAWWFSGPVRIGVTASFCLTNIWAALTIPCTTSPIAGVGTWTLNPQEVAPFHDGPGAVRFTDYDVDIDVYLDCQAQVWRPAVTTATAAAIMYWRLPDGAQEATPDAATAGNYCQMLASLVPSCMTPCGWFMVEAIKQHELAHVESLRNHLAQRFGQLRATIESLSVPNSGLTSTRPTARIAIKLTSEYVQAIELAAFQVFAAWAAEGHATPQTYAAELQVLQPMAFAIQAKAAQQLWPPCP